MTRRLCVLLVCALLPIGLVTSCGGGSSTTHARSTPTKTTSSPAALAARVRKAIAACQKGFADSPYVSAADKVAGKADCTAVRTGNVAAVVRLRAILLKACEATVIAKIPTANQPTGLAQCRKVY